MKIGGQILWNAIPICETSQIYCLMGRRPMRDVLACEIFRTDCLMGKHHTKGDFGEPCKGPRLFQLVHWLSITLSLRRTSQESINLERKVLPGLFLGYALYAGEFGRVTYWLQTLRSWKRWTHLKSTRKDSMQKR